MSGEQASPRKELVRGNPNAEVGVYRYVTDGSIDARMWQAPETKARSIGQVMTGRVGVRRADDVAGQELSYAGVKAIASGNPAGADPRRGGGRGAAAGRAAASARRRAGHRAAERPRPAGDDRRAGEAIGGPGGVPGDGGGHRSGGHRDRGPRVRPRRRRRGVAGGARPPAARRGPHPAVPAGDVPRAGSGSNAAPAGTTACFWRDAESARPG